MGQIFVLVFWERHELMWTLLAQPSAASACQGSTARTPRLNFLSARSFIDLGTATGFTSNHCLDHQIWCSVVERKLFSFTVAFGTAITRSALLLAGLSQNWTFGNRNSNVITSATESIKGNCVSLAGTYWSSGNARCEMRRVWRAEYKHSWRICHEIN